MSNKHGSSYYEKHYKRSIFHRRGDNPYVNIFWIKYIRKYKESGKLLEVGCGEGYFLKRISSYYSIWGIDINEYAVDIAREVAPKAIIKLCDATKLPFKTSFFDVIVAFDVIEHLRQPELFFKEANRVLKIGGILIVRTPNPISFGARIKREQWFGFRDETHVSILSSKEWKKILLDFKFIILEEGTDTLWDTPYFKFIPNVIQKPLFIGTHVLLNMIYRGFFNWSLGENWVCISMKQM